MAGDEKTGISVMLMSEGLDEGDILSILDVEILEDDTISVLTTKLANKGADLLVETILKYKSGLLSSKSQKQYGITYAKKSIRWIKL